MSEDTEEISLEDWLKKIIERAKKERFVAIIPQEYLTGGNDWLREARERKGNEEEEKE